MAAIDTLIRHEFQVSGFQADDPPPHDHVLPSDYDNGHILQGGVDGDLLTCNPANTSRGGWRTLVGSGAITVVVGASSITISAPSVATGSGTTDFVTRWTSASSIGTGIIRDNAAVVSFNAAVNANQLVQVAGAFSPASGGAALGVSTTLTAAVNQSVFGVDVAPTINEAASGTHADFASMQIQALVVGAGGAALTNAATLKLLGAPTGGANNFALWSTAGSLRFDGAGPHSIGGVLDTTAAFNLTGSFTGSSDAYGLRLAHTLSPAVNGDGYLFNTAAAAQINKAGSGTHDTFATMILRPIVIGAAGSALTNAATLKILAAPTGATNSYALWVAAGRSLLAGQTMIGTGAFGNDALFHVDGAWTGSVQTEMARMNASLTGVASANSFGVAVTPTFVEAASGTHGQLTALYVAPTFTNGGGATTNVFGVNIDTIATGALAPTNATGLRIAVPTGGTINRAVHVQSGLSQFDGIIAVSGAGGVVNTTNVGIELRGSVTPSLTAFRRDTSAYIPMVYDALSHDLQISGVTRVTVDSAGSFRVVNAGPHAFGAALNANIAFRIGGSFTGGTDTAGFEMGMNLTGTPGNPIYGFLVEPAFTEAASGNHAIIASFWLNQPTVTAGGSTVTDTAVLYIQGAMTATVTGDNYAMWIDAGNVRMDGLVSIGGAISTTTNLLVPASTTGVSSIRIPHGAAPTSPVDGDVWTTTAGMFVRINGVTVGPLT